MLEARPFVEDLALVLGVAGITALASRALRLPNVLGYLLAGLIVGPHVAAPLIADAGRVRALGELGVVLVMFSIGLDFSIRRLLRVLPTGGVIGVIQLSAMAWLGYAVGETFGWRPLECAFAGAIVAISSTMVASRLVEEERVPGEVADTVVGVLVFQDLAAVLLLALSSVIGVGGADGSSLLLGALAKLVAISLALLALGLLFVPRLIAGAARHGSETLRVVSVGLCFALALVAEKSGLSVALGAFLAGALVAESGESDRVAELVHPLRDVFGAVFFVAVGMEVDPRIVAEHGGAVLSLAAVVLLAQPLSVGLGALVAGRSIRTAVQSGMCLAQVGELSLVIASAAVASGAARGFLEPLTVSVAALTILASRSLVRRSQVAASWLDRTLPAPLQTLVSVYGTWLDQVRTARNLSTIRRRLLRALGWLLLDAGSVAALAAVASFRRPIGAVLARASGLSEDTASWLVLSLAGALALPFLLGTHRVARALASLLAVASFPAAEPGAFDRRTAARSALALVLELATLLLVGFPLLAISSPFISPGAGFAVLVVALSASAFSFWRGATDYDAHVRAGTLAIVEALGRRTAPERDHALVATLRNTLPGLGELTPVRVSTASPAIGRSLAELDLRASSGANVLAIVRSGEGIQPTGREQLREGDVLALAGSGDAIRAARVLLGDTSPGA